MYYVLCGEWFQSDFILCIKTVFGSCSLERLHSARARLCVSSHTLNVKTRNMTIFRFIRRVRKITKSDYHVWPSYHLSVWNTSAPAGRISRNFIFNDFCENLSRTFKFYWNLTRLIGMWHEHLCTFTIISWWMLLRMRSVLDKICRGNRNIHFMFNNFFFRKSFH